MTTISQFVIDPPWPKRKGGLRTVRPNQGRNLDYPTMGVPEIFALLDSEIFTQASTPHNVFLWNIDQFLIKGEQEMTTRGYRRHARFVWDKDNGVAPCFTVRYTHEYLVWYYKPNLLPVTLGMRGKATTIIQEKAREHSRKPDLAYRMIQQFYPDASRMDVFSREPREGWLQWGNECKKFTNVLTEENK